MRKVSEPPWLLARGRAEDDSTTAPTQPLHNRQAHGDLFLYRRLGDLKSRPARLPEPSLFGMAEDPAAGAADQQASAELLARLAEAETLLAAERASNQALRDDILRAHSEESVGVLGRDSSNSNGSVSAAAATEEGDPPPPAERTWRRNRRDDARPRPPWQNVLYKRQPYADNHVPDSFLEKLVTNGE